MSRSGTVENRPLTWVPFKVTSIDQFNPPVPRLEEYPSYMRIKQTSRGGVATILTVSRFQHVILFYHYLRIMDGIICKSLEEKRRRQKYQPKIGFRHNDRAYVV